MSGGSGGFAAAPDANGRTTASISIGAATYKYVAYIVNSNEVLLLSSDPIDTNPIASGMMLATSSSFTSSSASGNYIMAVNGSDAINSGFGYSSLGILNFSGSTSWSGTIYEYELDGPGDREGAPESVSGTYTVGAASGRIGPTNGPAIYLTNNSTSVAAFVIDLTSGPGAAAFEGILQVQPNETYSNSSVSGNFLDSIADMSSNIMGTVVGTGTASGGTVSLTENVSGLNEGLVAGYAQGTYTINANGTGVSGNGSNTLLLTNGTTVYLIDTTAQAEIVEFDQQ
jgi:hypothetical protein